MDFILPSPDEVDVDVKVSKLMRAIDAYAFDYQADGKLGASRRDVVRELRAALAAPRSEGGEHGQ